MLYKSVVIIIQQSMDNDFYYVDYTDHFVVTFYLCRCIQLSSSYYAIIILNAFKDIAIANYYVQKYFTSMHNRLALEREFKYLKSLINKK